MTKQEIFELHDSCLYYNPKTGTTYNKDEFVEKLLAKIEQEQSEGMKIVKITADREQEFALKEQAREIFEKIYNEVEYYSLGQVAIEQLAKEYGVEL